MLTEKIVIGENTKYPLQGLLTLPEDLTAPVPAVVFVHGSGASNMDEKVGKLTPFMDLAEGLAARGIASVRYDKRSFTHGLKMVTDKSLNITVKEETVEDAVAAAALLRADLRIDPERVFIIGHSMGAMLAPRIDAEGGHFAGLVLLAGTPRKLEEVMAEQLAESQAKMKGISRWIMEKQSKKILAAFEGLYDLSDEEAKQRKIGGGTTAYYFKEMGLHPVEGYLEKLDKPMLIMQGGMDFQVKVNEDYGAYQRLLAGRENVTFRLYEKLNHAFVPGIYGDITKAKKEYNVEQHIGSDVINDIADWIRAV